MQIIYGKSPTHPEPNRSKYADLWAALRQERISTEWLAISASDIRSSTTKNKKNLLVNAGKHVGLSLQVVVEGDLLFVRLRQAKATVETPAVKPVTSQAKPEQAGQPSPSPEAKRSLSEAPKTIPAPETPAQPQAAPVMPQAAPVMLLSSDLSAFLSDTQKCAPKWNELDLGDNEATYRPALREFKKLAAVRCVDVEARISDGYLHARVVKK